MDINDFLKDQIELLKKHQIIDERSLRDFRIRRRYKELRKKDSEGKSMFTAKEAREIINKEFYLSDKRIQAIVYDDRN